MQEKLHMSIHPGTNPPAFDTIIQGFDDINVLLESTYCYPKGGGQPGDMGVLSSKSAQAIVHEVLPGQMLLHPIDDPLRVGDGVERLLPGDGAGDTGHVPARGPHAVTDGVLLRTVRVTSAQRPRNVRVTSA